MPDIKKIQTKICTDSFKCLSFPDEEKKQIYDKCTNENKEKDGYCIIKRFYSDRLLLS